MQHLLPTATTTDEARRNSPVAVLPVGAFEQHGGHLPLVTDTAIACVIARDVADAYGLFLLPPITISCSHEHAAFRGTVSLSASTLMAIIDDIRQSLVAGGVRRLALVNAHGGNYVLANVVQEASITEFRMTLFPGRDDWRIARENAGTETTGHEDMHGGELETSILLHAAPELVGAEYPQADHAASDRPHLLISGMQAYTATGVVGRPSAASAEKGKALLESLTASFADHHRLLLEE